MMIDQKVVDEAKQALINADKERSMALARECVDPGNDPQLYQ